MRYLYVIGFWVFFSGVSYSQMVVHDPTSNANILGVLTSVKEQISSLDNIKEATKQGLEVYNKVKGLRQFYDVKEIIGVHIITLEYIKKDLQQVHVSTVFRDTERIISDSKRAIKLVEKDIDFIKGLFTDDLLSMDNGNRISLLEDHVLKSKKTQDYFKRQYSYHKELIAVREYNQQIDKHNTENARKYFNLSR